MPSSPFFTRAALIAGFLALSLCACGRRGAPEAPPDPSAPKTGQAAPEEDDEAALPSPVGTPRSKASARRGYTIPKSPFLLDPIL